MSKGTPKRQIRMPDETWAAVQDKAEREGTNASQIIRQLLTEWLDGDEADRNSL